MLVVNSVFIKPIIKGGLEIDVVSEISRSSWGHKKVRLVRNGVITVKLFACSFIVVFDQTKVKGVFWVITFLLGRIVVACLSLENNILFIKNIFKNSSHCLEKRSVAMEK